MKITGRLSSLWKRRWFRAILGIAVIAGVGAGLFFLVQYLTTCFDISVKELGPAGILVVFGVSLLSNASIIVPVAVHIAAMMAAAAVWNPFLIAFAASTGGTLGELTGYYAGYFEKRIAVNDSPGYARFAGWVKKYGQWAVFLLSLQPVIPFDIAGLVAGVAKMPLWRFLLLCWAGKFPKYVLFCYFGLGLIRLFSSSF
ncbi:MAG: VTT domain-containing protein [Chloroflexota bacterium]|nr:VTT domain-containing protein [Chloroflexota bacterium]